MTDKRIKENSNEHIRIVLPATSKGDDAKARRRALQNALDRWENEGGPPASDDDGARRKARG